MAASLLLLDPAGGGYRETLLIYAGLYAISGVGNFWAVGKPHPGGVLLHTAGEAVPLEPGASRVVGAGREPEGALWRVRVAGGRAEMRIILAEILDRLPNLELAGPV